MRKLTYIVTCTSVMNIIYFLFKYAMSKVIGNSSKQQALNGRMARKVLKVPMKRKFLLHYVKELFKL